MIATSKSLSADVIEDTVENYKNDVCLCSIK